MFLEIPQSDLLWAIYQTFLSSHFITVERCLVYTLCEPCIVLFFIHYKKFTFVFIYLLNVYLYIIIITFGMNKVHHG